MHQHAQQVVDRMVDARFAPKTVEGARTVLCDALQYATRLGLIHSNPARGLEMPREQPRDARVVWPADLHRLIGTMSARPELRGLYVASALLLTTGMRLGELLGLQTEDIDFDHGLVVFRRTLKKRVAGGVDSGSVKMHQQRVRPLRRGMAALLRQHLAEREMHRRRMGSGYTDLRLVFLRPDGRPHSDNVFRRRLTSAAQEAGVVRITPKDFRSTGETRLYEEGWPAELVSKWQGHSTKVSYGHYLSLTDRLATEAADVLDELAFPGEYAQDMHKTEVDGAS